MACVLIYQLAVIVLRKDFRVLGKIGEGTFSDVLKISSLIDGKCYACKRMKQKYSR